MNRGVFFNFLLLLVIFFSLYNEYALTKKCDYYFRKEDLVIEYLKASEVFTTCNNTSKVNCIIEKNLYTKTMLEMDKVLNK
tara:strand:- start:103 stop:345 length:243 start_codon:yes stop_codon:yes gene_type:complete